MIANRRGPTGNRLAPMAPGPPDPGQRPRPLPRYPGPFVRCYHEVGPIYRLRVPGRIVLAGPKANAFLLHGGERHFDSALVYRHSWRTDHARDGRGTRRGPGRGPLTTADAVPVT